MRYLCLIIIIITIACKSNKNSADNSENTVQNSNELTLILSDNYGGTETREILVIKKPGALKSFFTKINKTRKPGIPVPEIDFTTNMVIIYCSGQTTGSGIAPLYTMKETREKMILGEKKGDNTEITPSSAAIVPFGLYTLPLTDKEIVLDSLK